MHTAARVADAPERGRSNHWISLGTKELFKQRDTARQSGDTAHEQWLNTSIKKAVRRDKRKWLDSQLQGGSWAATKALRKAPGKTPIAIKNTAGEPVESDQRADTLADYFEKIQWDVKYADVHPLEDGPLGAPLPIATHTFTMGELKAALKNLAFGKAAGHDGIAPEFWKVLRMSSTACSNLLDVCQKCWEHKDIP